MKQIFFFPQIDTHTKHEWAEKQQGATDKKKQLVLRPTTAFSVDVQEKETDVGGLI